MRRSPTVLFIATRNRRSRLSRPGPRSPSAMRPASIRRPRRRPSNVSEYRQELDLRTGIVSTSGVWNSPGGNKTRFLYRVGTDRARDHLAVLTLELTPMWTGKGVVSSILDGAGGVVSTWLLPAWIFQRRRLREPLRVRARISRLRSLRRCEARASHRHLSRSRRSLERQRSK